MSQIGDLVVDAGVVFVVTFDGRQSLLGDRISMEPLIAISGFQKPVKKRHRERVRPNVRRVLRPMQWGRAS